MSPSLSLFTRSALLLAALVVVALGLVFLERQNQKGGLGGRISRPKLLWLLYAVYLWFVVCPLLALDSAVPAPMRLILGVFAVVMWLRGVAELVMLYVTKNWRPPYGVGHDVFSMVVVVIGLLHYRDEWGSLQGTLPLWTFALLLVLLASLAIETYYAAAFFRAVEGRTTGDDGVWFADEDDARFRRINRITTAFNVPLYAFLLLYLFAVSRT